MRHEGPVPPLGDAPLGCPSAFGIAVSPVERGRHEEVHRGDTVVRRDEDDPAEVAAGVRPLARRGDRRVRAGAQHAERRWPHAAGQVRLHRDVDLRRRAARDEHDGRESDDC